MSRTIRASAGPLRGTVEVPGDKSISHRALILGALAEGDTELRNLPQGRDVLATRLCLERLGIEIRDTAPPKPSQRGASAAPLSGGRREVVVMGAGLDGLKEPQEELDCGNSGTTMRLLMGALAGQPFTTVLSGDASLSRRPMRRVADPLSDMGAELELAGKEHAPVRVKGRRPLRALSYRLPAPSAQVKSAVLLAGLFAEGETVVQDPYGTRDHTERMLGLMGGPGVLRREGASASTFVKRGVLRAPGTIEIPGDPSSAAFFAAAAALVPGSSLTLRRVLLNDTRSAFFDVLRDMGVRVERLPLGDAGGEPMGDVEVRHSALRATKVAADRVPRLVDEVPLLAVLAARAEGETRLEGLGELRLKESDRLAGTAAGLSALGAEARIDGDALVVSGPSGLRGGVVETHGDHRLAMAFAVAALVSDGETALSDADCAAVSFPGFFDELRGLGA